MKENAMAAIVAAVNAYMREETRVAPSVMPATTVSPWKVFGIQELMRKRTSMQRRGSNR